ncbi:MAG: hypothetical protein QME85_11660 [Candidatus Saccharicenans sp.]|nr:hypothetical protein [Candidatus Saccharicenans sp.]
MNKPQGIRLILILIISLAFLIPGPAVAQKSEKPENNDFYDNIAFKELPVWKIEISGEIVSPGIADLRKLPLHQVQVREAIKNDEKATFIGAYVYQGYSLFDILMDCALNKNNKNIFSSPIDLLVIIENKEGERVVFSWGEIFYPNSLHRIIIARRVAPIIPSTTGESWPLPDECKVVAANDLYGQRNLRNPVKIMVRSCPLAESVKKDKTLLYSEKIKVLFGDKEITIIESLPAGNEILEYPVVFFGRGKGFHGVKSFSGVSLRKILGKYIVLNKGLIEAGYAVIVGADGYRAVFSISELFNRNDFNEVLLYDQGNKNGGRFALFVSMDFFSDRAVKAIKEIRLISGD